MYERAIAALEAHRLREWIVYPKAWLAQRLVWAESDVDRADRLARECLELARAHQDPQLWQCIYTSLTWVAVRRSEWASMRESFEASLPHGGPFVSFFKEMIDTIEEACHQSGEGYRRANLKPPLRHWHLVPTAPHFVREPPLLREEFDSVALHPQLRWYGSIEGTRIDPHTRPGWIRVWPALGSNLWADLDMNAPRLLTAVAGVFVAQIRVEVDAATPAQAGLLLWKDEHCFVRLELRMPYRGRNRVLIESCAGTSYGYDGRGQCEQKPVWLRLERAGDGVRGLCSVDGEDWFLVGTVDFPPEEEVQVGVHAIWVEPGSSAWFSQFCLWKG
jgi:regulation of enolase protein 1 (concanavalin A-like superfamily)